MRIEGAEPDDCADCEGSNRRAAAEPQRAGRGSFARNAATRASASPGMPLCTCLEEFFRYSRRLMMHHAALEQAITSGTKPAMTYAISGDSLCGGLPVASGTVPSGQPSAVGKRFVSQWSACNFWQPSELHGAQPGGCGAGSVGAAR